MPSRPASGRISAKHNATSVTGRCRPVKTLASLIGLGNGSVAEESVTDSIRSRTAGAVADGAVGTGVVVMRSPGFSGQRTRLSGRGSADEAGALGVEGPAGNEVLHGHR